MTIDIFNFGRKVSTATNWQDGEHAYKAGLTIGKEVIDFNNTKMAFGHLKSGVGFVSKEVGSHGLVDGGKSIFNQSSSKFLQEGLRGGKIDYNAHLFWGGTEKYVPKAVQALDKSLLETGVGQKVLAKLGGSVVRDGSGAIKSVTGGTAANVAGKTMSRIPVLGILISTAFEVPDIIDGFKNGDGMAQLGRSAVNVACTTVCAAALGALLAPIPGGALIGAFIGGWIGSKLGKCLGNAIFGKSIKDKMKDGDMAKETMQKWQTLSANNLNSVYNTSGNYNTNYNYSNQSSSGSFDMQGGVDFLNNLNANLAHINSI